MPRRRPRRASASACPRWWTSRGAGSSPRSTSRWPTSPLREVLGERLGVPVFVDNDATVAALAEAHDEELEHGRPRPGDADDRHRRRRRPRARRADLPRGDRRRRRARPHARRADLERAGAAPTGSSRSPARSSRSPPARPGPARGAASPRRTPTRRSGGCGAAGEDADRRRGRAGRAGRRPEARADVELWGERVGIGIANAINTFDPEEVVIGGGAAQAGELLLEPAPADRRGLRAARAWAPRRRSASRATAFGPECSARRCWPSTSSSRASTRPSPDRRWRG